MAMIGGLQAENGQDLGDIAVHERKLVQAPPPADRKVAEAGLRQVHRKDRARESSRLNWPL